MIDNHLLGTIRALRNLLIDARDRDVNPRTGTHSDMEALARLNAAIAALNALLPEQWRLD